MNSRYLLAASLLATITVGFYPSTSDAFVRKSVLAAHAQSSTATGEVATLRQAYSALRSADHDYHGHRIKAMHAIEAAVKELGARVEGNGRGHEVQGKSDEQLQKAKSLLESAATSSAAHPRAARHVHHAIHELTIALSIK